VATSATRPASIGEITAGTTTFVRTVPKCTAPVPAATSVAPMSPPNSACDELDGRPSSQVSRFHMIAPTSPAKITTGPICASSTIPLEIVLATSTERNAPTRFRTPAIVTAVFGESAPVAIEVAIAFAVSWNPLVKSKMSAVATTTTTINVTSMRAFPELRSDGSASRARPT
jgi:hypothetical protein